MPEPVFAKAPVWTWKKFYAWVLGVFVLLGAYTFFFSGGKKEAAEIAERPTEVIQAGQTDGLGKEIIRIPLQGVDRPSEKFLGPRMVPAGWDYFFEGPPSAKVHFDDGTVGPITKWYGVKGGIRRFSGPEGEEVVVRVYPPQ